jgi:hypothetical protein
MLYSGWYQRNENNGWRPVSDKVFNNEREDSVTQETTKAIAFHYSKLKRRHELEKKKREKKLEWLRTM